jgi:hypothetical protein
MNSVSKRNGVVVIWDTLLGIGRGASRGRAAGGCLWALGALGALGGIGDTRVLVFGLEELNIVEDNLDFLAFLSTVVGPLVHPQMALDIGEVSLGEVLGTEISQLSPAPRSILGAVEGFHVEEAGFVLVFAGLLVAAAVVDSEAEASHLAARLEGGGFDIAGQAPDALPAVQVSHDDSPFVSGRDGNG